jgi:hypothetical protein
MSDRKAYELSRPAGMIMIICLLLMGLSFAIERKNTSEKKEFISQVDTVKHKQIYLDSLQKLRNNIGRDINQLQMQVASKATIEEEEPAAEYLAELEVAEEKVSGVIDLYKSRETKMTALVLHDTHKFLERIQKDYNSIKERLRESQSAVKLHVENKQ